MFILLFVSQASTFQVECFHWNRQGCGFHIVEIVEIEFRNIKTSRKGVWHEEHQNHSKPINLYWSQSNDIGKKIQMGQLRGKLGFLYRRMGQRLAVLDVDWKYIKSSRWKKGKRIWGFSYLFLFPESDDSRAFLLVGRERTQWPIPTSGQGGSWWCLPWWWRIFKDMLQHDGYIGKRGNPELFLTLWNIPSDVTISRTRCQLVYQVLWV